MPADRKKLALNFVLAMGVVSLFGDMTYEGMRGIAGQFLLTLGATAATVGFVAGFGELAGYGLRSVFGYWADKTHNYWGFIFVGFTVQLLAVPALALAGNWPLAAALMVAERTGRAIRRPSVQAMLSHAGSQIGTGWAFGLHEALDQTGATLGPLITALILYLHGGYHYAFAVLLITAILSLASLVIARIFYPRPHELEERSPVALQAKGFSRVYWLYAIAGMCVAAGFADFSLIAFHFQRTSVVPQSLIPVFYSVAMVTGAITPLIFGKLLDKMGLAILLLAFLLGALFAPCVFLGGFSLALVGMILWGLGLGAQDSLLKAVLSAVIPKEKRSTGFGVFDTAFGVAWFAGSAAMGLLYDKSILAVVIFSVALQLAALPFFVLAKGRRRPS
ncbi:MAG TPA: MFS transporter [Verrucomicrobiae bacterium]|nr:MFS transporter [Verrucomicrobiae bacterium]